MVLGVGFYGYGFGPTLTSPAVTMNYGEIVAQFPNAQNTDQIELPSGATMYYNGIPTMTRKTELAKSKASGIMIWQISGDATGKYSLLKTIHEVGYGNK